MLFKGRILAEILFVFLLTTFAVCNINNKFVMPLLIIVSFLFLFIIAISGLIKNKTTLKHILCILGAIIAAAGYFLVFYNINEKPVLTYLDTYEDTEVTIKAKINKITRYSYYTRLDLRVDEIDNKKVNHNLNLDLSVFEIIYADIDDIVETKVVFTAIEAGDVVYNRSNGFFISAEHVEPIDADQNIETYDSDEFNEVESYTPSSVKITPAESHSLIYHLDRLQNYVRDVFIGNIRISRDSDILQTTVTQEIALVYGIFTGKSNYIEPRVKTNFNRAGIAHIISVSGLHLSIFTGIIFSFLNIFRLHKKLVCVIVIICCICFMAFTGFPLSVIRSGIMTVLYYFAFLLSRKNDSITSLFIAGAVICVITPYNILNIGFQLSFLATLGIVTTSGATEKIISKIPAVSLIDTENTQRFTTDTGLSEKLILKLHMLLQAIFYLLTVSLVSSVFITLAAIIFTLPVTSYVFKTLSLISPLINLVVSPFITLIFLFAFMLILFSFVPYILFIFGEPLYFFSRAVLNIATFGASFKYSCISVNSTKYDMFLTLSVIFLILLVLFFIVYSYKKAIDIIFSALIFVCVILMCANLIYVRYIFKDSLRAAYYSDYKNQSIILFHDNYEKADIIDITHGVKTPVYGIRNIILDNGAANIGSVVLTHYHKRHVQMLERFMSYCTIDRVFVPSPRTDYDREVFTMLFDFAVNDDDTYRKSYELFMYYDGIVDLNDTAVIVNEFNYNSMRHMTVDIRRGERKFLYLGIGYGNIYSYISDTYDVVFYGTHKHNRRDDDYSAGIYGLHYGVLSDYLNNYKNKSTQRLEQNVLEAYDFEGDARLIYSGEAEEFYPVFEITKDDELYYYSRRKP